MFCDQAKEYLLQKGIEFQEKDIAQDPDALADLKKLGYMTTPVIVIDRAVIVGFDTAKIELVARVHSLSRAFFAIKELSRQRPRFRVPSSPPLFRRFGQNP